MSSTDGLTAIEHNRCCNSYTVRVYNACDIKSRVKQISNSESYVILLVLIVLSISPLVTSAPLMSLVVSLVLSFVLSLDVSLDVSFVVSLVVCFIESVTLFLSILKDGQILVLFLNENKLASLTSSLRFSKNVCSV